MTLRKQKFTKILSAAHNPWLFADDSDEPGHDQGHGKAQVGEQKGGSGPHGEGHAAEVVDHQENAADHEAGDNDHPDSSGGGQAKTFLIYQQVVEQDICCDSQEKGRKNIVNQVGDVKIRRPCHAGDVGYVIAFVKGHLTES